jgi:DNA (cytosine-5)-methyltransferase 1
MRFGSLFAGIGGMDLGLERAGMQCAWQVEIDPYARRVLEKHWPSVPRHDDVRTFPPEGDWSCDLICGGFPCQDISKAGHVQGERHGISGERSGLWAEYIRIIRRLRPGFVLVENVAKLLVRGMGRILGDLASLGMDAEWHCLPAAAVGAPHIRDRVFILAYTVSQRLRLSRRAPIARPTQAIQAEAWQWQRLWTHPYAVGPLDGVQGYGADGSWNVEPGVDRVVDGLPFGVDRNRGLGNAVVPQVAEWLGERIMEAVKESP